MRRAGEECPFSLLCGDYETGFLMRRKGKFRQNVRNYRRKLSKDHRVAVERCESAADLDGFFADLARLHGAARSIHGEKSRYADPAYFGFQRDVAQSLLAGGDLGAPA